MRESREMSLSVMMYAHVRTYDAFAISLLSLFRQISRDVSFFQLLNIL